MSDDGNLTSNRSHVTIEKDGDVYYVVVKMAKMPTYSITVNTIGNGNVFINHDGYPITEAMEGTTVVVYATPDNGYVLDTLTVMQGETEVPFNDNQFTMPAGDVTVFVTFKAEESSETNAYLSVQCNGSPVSSGDPFNANWHGLTFTASVTGASGEVTYQWFVNQTIGGTGASIPLSETDSYTVNVSDMEMEGVEPQLNLWVYIDGTPFADWYFVYEDIPQLTVHCNDVELADGSSVYPGDTLVASVDGIEATFKWEGVPKVGSEYIPLSDKAELTVTEETLANWYIIVYAFDEDGGYIASLTFSPKAIYTVTLADTEHGTVAFADGYTSPAKPDSEVCLNITPDEGYELDSVDIISNTTHMSSAGFDYDSYGFVMPEDDVTVHVEFGPKTHYIGWKLQAVDGQDKAIPARVGASLDGKSIYNQYEDLFSYQMEVGQHRLVFNSVPDGYQTPDEVTLTISAAGDVTEEADHVQVKTEDGEHIVIVVTLEKELSFSISDDLGNENVSAMDVGRTYTINMVGAPAGYTAEFYPADSSGGYYRRSFSSPFAFTRAIYDECKELLAEVDWVFNSFYAMVLDEEGNLKWYDILPVNEPEDTYTVTVTNGTGSGEYEEGATVTITANRPAAGKRFAGWTSNDVTLTNANAATTTFVMPAKAVTVTANYTDVPVAVHYTVVYNANGGTGAMANQYFNYGETKALLANAFTREGYVFTGWNTKADGTGTAYANGQVVTMYNAVILYAQWVPVEMPDVPAPTPTPTPDPVVTPLEIIQQPADQMVAPGEKAQFSIVANGDAVTFQWFINRNDGRGWVKLQGATSAAYETSVADPVYDGFQYACEVRDTHGNMVRSNIAVLYVAANPNIPETGDATNLPLLSAMLLLSMLGGLMLVNRKHMAN